jgi:hypothetical protein
MSDSIVHLYGDNIRMHDHSSMSKYAQKNSVKEKGKNEYNINSTDSIVWKFSRNLLV